MALCDVVTFQTVKQKLQHSRFFSGMKNLYSRFKINGIVAVLRFFLSISNLAKKQIFSRNVSNVKQLIGSMGDMDRTSVFFSYSRPPRPRSQINMTDCGLERYKIYCILMGKRPQMPMFTSQKVATRHYSILNLYVSGWRFPCEFAHFNSSAKR